MCVEFAFVHDLKVNLWPTLAEILQHTFMLSSTNEAECALLF